MMRPTSIVVALAACAFALTAPALAHEPAVEMGDAARRFVASLDDDARTKAVFAFDAEARKGWAFVPKQDRAGLKIADMSAQQRLLAHALLKSGLSHHGYRKAITIMTLEAVLHDMENKNPIRNPEFYHVAIFGEPGAPGGRTRRGAGGSRAITCR